MHWDVKLVGPEPDYWLYLELENGQKGLAECLQVVFDAGGKRVTLPMASAADIATIPTELFTKFQTSFYAEPVDAVVKALGVE